MMTPLRPSFVRFLFVPTCLVAASGAAQAQFRFTLRAEPNVIPAGGLATTSIFVQVPQRGSIAQNGVVRFATTAGVIESQAQLSGGVARVLLRSAPSAGTAVVTAFVGSARESIAVEFSEDSGVSERFLQISAPYAAYGQTENQITAAGRSVLEFGDLRIESDVRLDVDLYSERVWAQGNRNGIKIQHGRGDKAKFLVGDRLFYDLRRKRGVIRRAEGDLSNSEKGARQEFAGTSFGAATPLPEEINAQVNAQNQAAPNAAATVQSETGTTLLPPSQVPAAAPLEARDGVEASPTAEENARAGAMPLTPVQPAENPLGTGLPSVEENLKSAPETQSASTTARIGEQRIGEQLAPQPETVVSGSLADNPAAIREGETIFASPLVAERSKAGDGTSELETAPHVPPYSELGGGNAGYTPVVVELPAPTFDAGRGYWVTARRLRVFPRDEVQFERARIYFNGKKAFSSPVYVLPLDGSFNPTTDMFAFNSSGGLGVRVPVYYMANAGGTGSVTFRNDLGNGFGAGNSGPSLELRQQYYLSRRSEGEVSVDSIGNGAWNLNAQHRLQFGSKTAANFYLNMPRHRDLFARASLTREVGSAQIGLEAFFDRPELERQNLRGQFYARMRPRSLGNSGWTASLGVTALGVQNAPFTRLVAGGRGNGGGFGGGVGIPGQGGFGGGVGVPGQGNSPNVPQTQTFYRSLFGQQLSVGLQSPNYSPLPGSVFNANLFASAFNYSDGRRGAAPGLTMSFSQSLGRRADLRLDYTYDRSNLGLYGATSDSFTHYASASLGVRVSDNIDFTTFLSRSLRDNSTYGNADLSFALSKHWRAGLFADYSNFQTDGKSVNYGLSLGRTVAGRNVSVNWDAVRGKFYLEIGSQRY